MVGILALMPLVMVGLNSEKNKPHHICAATRNPVTASFTTGHGTRLCHVVDLLFAKLPTHIQGQLAGYLLYWR